MEGSLVSKKRIVDFFLKNNILVSSDAVASMKEEDLGVIQERITNKIKSDNFLLLSKDLDGLLKKLDLVDINWFDLEKAKTMLEKGKDSRVYQKFIDYLEKGESKKPAIAKEASEQYPVKVLFSYEQESKKRDVQDFIQFFNARYKAIEKILRSRQELQNITSINRIINKKERGAVSLIGMVGDKKTTKNENLVLTIEDPTGAIKVLVNKNKPELYKEAKEIALDEVIAVVGTNGENIVFANTILWPDIAEKELNKSDDEAYALFLSDLHVGSNNFLSEDFNRFIKWINGEMGSEQQKNIAKQVKYIFIIGDLVDGCGIYPEQDKELHIDDVYRQYDECARLLKQIPPSIKLIICPGNHDAMRIAEPQPALYRDFAKSIYELTNTILVSNPALVNIHSSKTSKGFDVLMYHGYSFDYFVANVDAIRNKGGYNRADLIMKFLLQRRHLAPTHTSTLYIPDANKDPLVIEKAPDFFVTGHIHKSIAANYKNITMICGSCWQSKTAFQEKVGHVPEPSRVPLVNLKTREIKILKFGK